MKRINENIVPKKQANYSGNIIAIVRNYLPVNFLMGGFFSLVWTPSLMNPSLMLEMGFISPKPTIFNFLQVATVFTLITTIIVVAVSLANLEIKKRVHFKLHILGTTIGEIFGIIIGIQRFGLSRFCGNTTPANLLGAQFITILFWAIVGFILGLSITIVSEKIILYVKKYSN